MKKVAGIVLMFALLMVFAAIPVMAEPVEEHRIEASLAQTSKAYVSANPNKDTLTKRCLDAGLESNPYPAPLIDESFKVPGNPDVEQVRGGSLYFILNHLVIGEKDYTLGVACFFYSGLQARQQNGMVIHHFDATLYIGLLGEMDNGFKGWVQMKVYGWDMVAKTIEYATWYCTLVGFGDFEGQTLRLSFEANDFAEFMASGGVTKPWTGYCNKE